MQITDIIIAETGHPPGGLDQTHGRYTDMMSRMIGEAGGRARIHFVDVEHGETLPPAREGQALLVTGSPAGAYEDHAWIPPLEDSIRAHMAARAPVVGICFGHQIVAQAMGGEVKKVPQGWGVGVHTYQILPGAPWEGGPDRLSCAVSHQDQVVTLPDGAVRIGGSPFCPNGILHYPQGRGLTFQMHPEFTHPFAVALFERRLDRFPEHMIDWARASYRTSSDRLLIGRWISQFLHGEIG